MFEFITNRAARNSSPIPDEIIILTFDCKNLFVQEKLQVTMNQVLKKYKDIAKSRKLPTEQDPDFKEAVELLIQAAMISKIEKPKKGEVLKFLTYLKWRYNRYMVYPTDFRLF